DALLGAISELVDNATKYGEPNAGVDIVVRRAGASAEVAVLDRGAGVPAAERERIFEPFHRLGDELVRERPGVGLGLALVRGVALAHSGSVRCEPREGGGSCFVLQIPLETRA
ncbi:MAG: ATP-binding protein, partial [Planctomycetota bacterium]|nr:ATP-binding protein [Planctomycetota bacterium]